MDRNNKTDKQYSEGHDESDFADNSQQQRHSVRQAAANFEVLKSPSGIEGDSAYHTFHHSSLSKSTSIASSSSGRFPSEESLRSCSPASINNSSSNSNKKTHSTLIRIQLGDDKKISHEWYSQFTSQSHHNQAFNSPLAKRAANSSSQFEYDSHIAHMRGKF